MNSVDKTPRVGHPDGVDRLVTLPRPRTQSSSLAPRDFAPDFVLPNAAGVPTRFYGVAGGRPTLMVFLSADHGAVALEAVVAMTRDRGVELVVVTRTDVDGLDDVRTFVDIDGRLGEMYGVADGTSFVLHDENLRLVEVVDAAAPADWSTLVDRLATESVAVPTDVTGHAPVLLIPDVIDGAFCDRLMEIWAQDGNSATGVERLADGARAQTRDADLKRRTDHVVSDPRLLNDITQRVGRRVMPEVRKALGFRADSFEGFKICCYDARVAGFFKPHRDNLSPATAHRRFAISLNLNEDYEGGRLQFPEYGPYRYRPGRGSAVVFSSSLVHESLPVTEGRRFVLLSFLFRQDERSRPAKPSR